MAKVTQIRITAEDVLREGSPEKCGIWVAHGTPCVWAVNPETFSVAVFRAGRPTEVYEGAGTVDAAPALPGFELDLEDLFAGLASC